MTEKRVCGACSLCCKLMAVPEVTARGEWCRHAAPGKGGCLVYGDRPEQCREFSCVWLKDLKFKDYWYPKLSRIVIDIKVNPAVVAFIVDPSMPDRWRMEPYSGEIKAMAKAGIEGRGGMAWTTVIMVGEDVIPVI
jgi:hypothetical protein